LSRGEISTIVYNALTVNFAINWDSVSFR
jgi:hypothetical protein